MRNLIVALFVVLVVGVGSVGVSWANGWLALPFGPDRRELAMQLRDRGTVARAGRVPFGLRRDGTDLVDYRSFAPVAAALEGRQQGRVGPALRALHLDGLLVRTDDDSLGAPGSVLRRLATMQAVPDLTASYIDDTTAFYTQTDSLGIDETDARRLVSVVRLILQGALPPSDRLFSEPLRRSRPSEVLVTIRNGHDPLLWRASRGSSISHALVDAAYAVSTHWATRHQQSLGPVREAVVAYPMTVAVFYDRGTLGARSEGFLRRAGDPSVFALGYERRGQWEYVLPPTPWAHPTDPIRALRELVRERGVTPPGFLRPELSLYRFRAFQIIEREPQGSVELFDPS